MQKYLVDLSFFPNDKVDKILKIISETAFDYYFIANKPNVFEVEWDNSSSIEEVCHIPSNFITLLQ